MLRVKVALLLAIVALPTLTLVPLGSLWLWQNGLLLPWIFAALILTATLYALAARWLIAPAAKISPTLQKSSDGISATEAAAWAAVETYAAGVAPASIRSRTDVLDIAARTVEAVARQYHPNDKTPVWNFTVPELLLLTERVSERLRPVFIETIPLAEQLSVGQMLRLYEWRSVAGLAENAYDIWRLLRVVNPVAALTNEARDRVSKQILSSLREDVTRRLIHVIVREIGSAAIDLYSGRLREPAHTIDGATGAAAPDTQVPRPARSRLSTIWNEAGKVGRGARALYWRKPVKK